MDGMNDYLVAIFLTVVFVVLFAIWAAGEMG